MKDLMSGSDLQYDYSWTVYKNDDPEVTGKPDSMKFNRNEGYEVLYLINKIAENLGQDKKSFGKKVEELINEKLPNDIVLQKEVYIWLLGQLSKSKETSE